MQPGFDAGRLALALPGYPGSIQPAVPCCELGWQTHFRPAGGECFELRDEPMGPLAEDHVRVAVEAITKVESVDLVERAILRLGAYELAEHPEIPGLPQDPSLPEAPFQAQGLGSGFVWDREGHIVTNNHVVTGAAFLQVWVGGEDEPRNAQILGVSECSDLAVIDTRQHYIEILMQDAEAGLKPFDILPLIPIVERAGGVVTTWEGGDPRAGGRILAAGNPEVHAAAVAMLSG